MELSPLSPLLPPPARHPRSRFAASCLAFACSALSLGVSGHAQEPGAETDAHTADVPRYTVELIVFAYDESVPTGNEMFVPDEPPDDFIPEFSDDTLEPHRAQDEPVAYGDGASAARGDGLRRVPEPATVAPGAPVTAGDGNADFEEPPARKWIELQLLASQEAKMNEIHQRLVNLDAYHPIMRAAWTQTTPAKEQAPAVHLQALGEAPAGLDGNVTLYSGRYVHLVVDLSMDAAGGAGGSTATDRLVRRDDERLQGGYGRDDETARSRLPVRYRITEDRIMRNGDIRYFDHPKFGVIARVTRTEDPAEGDDPEADETIAGSD